MSLGGLLVDGWFPPPASQEAPFLIGEHTVNDKRSVVDGIVGSLDGLPGWTVKLDIAGHDVYAKLAFYGERLVYIDVTLSSMGDRGEIMTTARDATNEATKTDNARAMVELLCRQANTLLQSGSWDEESMIAAWIGTDFEPQGWCSYPDYGQDHRDVYVSSPLDAVAKLVNVRLAGWRRKLGEQHPRSEQSDVVVDGGGSVPGRGDSRGDSGTPAT